MKIVDSLSPFIIGYRWPWGRKEARAPAPTTKRRQAHQRLLQAPHQAEGGAPRPQQTRQHREPELLCGPALLRPVLQQDHVSGGLVRIAEPRRAEDK